MKVMQQYGAKLRKGEKVKLADMIEEAVKLNHPPLASLSA